MKKRNKKIMISPFFILFAIVIVGILLFSCTKEQSKTVTIYTSLDQIFSEPILQIFQEKTSIRVKTVYDVEATKTTGLVNRLIAEKDHPRADLFWNSEVGRTIVLKSKGVLQPYRSPSAADIPAQFKDPEGYWAGFAARARVLVYNTNSLSENDLPKSIFDFTAPVWRGRVAFAYPLFGTTATHTAALFVLLGRDKAKEYFLGIRDNGVVIVDGNSTSRDMVQNGEIPIGFTDTDDVNVALQKGKPVGMIYPDQEGIGTLLIPNTVALVAGCPHPEEGKRLVDYLLSREVEEMLAHSGSAQMPLRPGVKTPSHVPSFDSIRAMKVDFEAIASVMEETGAILKEIFIR